MSFLPPTPTHASAAHSRSSGTTYTNDMPPPR